MSNVIILGIPNTKELYGFRLNVVFIHFVAGIIKCKLIIKKNKNVCIH